MALKLVKTIGGTNGSPIKCKVCDKSDFSKIGSGWSCLECGLYHPVTFAQLKNNLDELNVLNNDLRQTIDCLEKLVESLKNKV